MADVDEPLSIGEPYGARASTCGYCGPPGGRTALRTSFSFGLETIQLSAQVYQDMIDRGWRRSGTYCYKPDLGRSCCPQYTIRLDAKAFTPSRSQRKVVYRFNRFVRGGADPEAAKPPGAYTEGGPGKAVEDAGPKKKHKGKQEDVFDLVSELRSVEACNDVHAAFAHRYEVTLEPSKFTKEKFKLYAAYQKGVHKEDEKYEGSFKRFLCDTPIKNQRIPYPSEPSAHLPKEYGSYHMMYRLDGELIAMGVVDILPSCISSVYLMYNPKHEQHSLGKLSALDEVALARQLATAGAPGLEYVYMGFYIHTCQKMRYKATYAPSFLLDPEDFTWHAAETALKLLDKHVYVPFSHPEKAARRMEGIEVKEDGDDMPMGDDDGDWTDDGEDYHGISPLSESELKEVTLGEISGGTVYVRKLGDDDIYSNTGSSTQQIKQAATLLGPKVIQKLILLA